MLSYHSSSKGSLYEVNIYLAWQVFRLLNQIFHQSMVRKASLPIAVMTLKNWLIKAPLKKLHCCYWMGRLPTRLSWMILISQLRDERRLKYKVRTIMKNLPTSGHPMEMLQTAVASLGMFYGGEEVLSDGIAGNDVEYIHSMSVKIISRMATIVAMWEHVRNGYDPIEPRVDLSHAANFLYMLDGKDPDPLAVKIMDACLVLHAEHTINASTFAAMVCASTLASPFLVIAAAIGTLAGPLHGGANQRVVEMLKKIERPENVKPWLDKQLADKESHLGNGASRV